MTYRLQKMTFLPSFPNNFIQNINSCRYIRRSCYGIRNGTMRSQGTFSFIFFIYLNYFTINLSLTSSKRISYTCCMKFDKNTNKILIVVVNSTYCKTNPITLLFAIRIENC